MHTNHTHTHTSRAHTIHVGVPEVVEHQLVVDMHTDTDTRHAHTLHTRTLHTRTHLVGVEVGLVDHPTEGTHTPPILHAHTHARTHARTHTRTHARTHARNLLV